MSDFQDRVESLGRYKIWILSVVVVALAGAGIYGFLEHQKDVKEKETSQKFYSVEKRFADKKKAFLEADQPPPQMNDPKSEAKKPVVSSGAKKTGDLQKDYGDVLPDLQKFAEEHKDSKSGAVATVLLSEVYSEYKKLSDINPLIDNVANAQPNESFSQGVLMMISGNAHAEQNQCDLAIPLWTKILANKNTPFLHGEAALRAGLCYEKINNFAKAQEMYKKAGELSKAGSSTTTQAQQYLRFAESQSGATQL